MKLRYYFAGIFLVSALAGGTFFSWQHYDGLQNTIRDFQKANSDLSAQVQTLHIYRYRSQSQLAATGISTEAQNNPFFSEIAAIRTVKKSAPSMGEMWARLKPFAEKYHHFGDGRDTAIGAMLVVGAFYDYGNAVPHDTNGGCVSINQNTDFKSIGELTFDAMTQGDIGCCTDFTLMLVSFLKYLNFDTQAIVTSGHQAVKVQIDSKSHLLDANTLIFAQDYFSGSQKQLTYFTPYEGTRVSRFQRYAITSLVFGLDGFEKDAWKAYTPDDHYNMFEAYFLLNS